MKAVYPGSFDPITNGHLDIILRSTQFIDELIVAVVNNPNKKCFFTLEERKEIISKVLHNHIPNNNIKVVSYHGLLVDFVHKTGSRLIIRGLRAVSDFDYELKLTMMNRHLNQDIETLYLMTDEKNLFVNSSLLREIAILGGNIEEHLPHYAYIKLKEKINTMKKD